MPYFALLYEVVDDFLARRSQFRADHLAHVKRAYAESVLVLAGALAEPPGALLVFQATDKTAVESFANADPYVTNSLVSRWEVRPWNVVTGNEALPEPIVPSHPTEIVRSWTARATPQNWSRYHEHFSKNVLPELRRTTGYLGANLLTRASSSEIEIVVETFWRSLDAIRSFAGVDIENAVVADEAADVLSGYDRRVRHFEIALSDRASP